MADLLLYTAPTMNGWKPLIFLEEAGVDYDLRPIDFDQKEQKEPWYLELNPNGRIPTLVDRAADDFVVFESAAILWYLAERTGQFLPEDPKARSRTLQWLFFQMAGVGPMMGQAMWFRRIARPKGHDVPLAIDRYTSESHQLLEVLDGQLAKAGPFLLGDYTIADMATYPWARSHYWAGVSVEGLDHLNAWFERLDARPAIQRALQLPEPRPAFFGEGDVASGVKKNASQFDV